MWNTEQKVEARAEYPDPLGSLKTPLFWFGRGVWIQDFDSAGKPVHDVKKYKKYKKRTEPRFAGKHAWDKNGIILCVRIKFFLVPTRLGRHGPGVYGTCIWSPVQVVPQLCDVTHMISARRIWSNVGKTKNLTDIMIVMRNDADISYQLHGLWYHFLILRLEFFHKNTSQKCRRDKRGR